MITLPRQRPYIIPLLVFFIGIMASVSIYSLMTELSLSDRKEVFLQQANNHFFAVEEHMFSTQDVLTSLKAFVKNTDNLKRENFDNFASVLLQRHQEIQALEWIPRVPNNQRSRYEARAQAEGYTGYQIKERLVNDGKSGLASAIDRPEYFPVYYAYPFQGNEAAIGFDLGSNPERLKALTAARDTGDFVVTQRITLVQETGTQAGILMFLPMYEARGVPDDLEKRREQLTGFVLIVLRVGDLIEKSQANLDNDIDILVTDTGSFETLYDQSDVSETKHEFTYQKAIEFGQREWLFRFSPKAGAYADTQLPIELLVLFGALSLTFLSGGYVFFLVQSHQKSLLEVESKTSDLKKSEQRFSLAAEGASVGIWDWIDVNGEDEYWSPQFYDLLGYEGDEIKASLTNFSAAIHPDDVDRTFAMVEAHLKGEGIFDIEYRLKTKSGNYKWFRGSGQVGRDREGNPKRMVGSI
ncbi:hypothetical protein A9Q97_05240, partial [Rhodospirillales bacterium 47_12_T64]